METFSITTKKQQLINSILFTNLFTPYFGEDACSIARAVKTYPVTGLEISCELLDNG